jgi:hypothetical protein
MYCGATDDHPPHFWAEWRWCIGKVSPQKFPPVHYPPRPEKES